MRKLCDMSEAKVLAGNVCSGHVHLYIVIPIKGQCCEHPLARMRKARTGLLPSHYLEWEQVNFNYHFLLLR